jgi:hypothetical protein
MLCPGDWGSLGLMVATSKEGLASDAIGLGGSGIAHAVSALARSRSSGIGIVSSIQVPAIDLPSPDILPS